MCIALHPFVSFSFHLSTLDTRHPGFNAAQALRIDTTEEMAVLL